MRGKNLILYKQQSLLNALSNILKLKCPYAISVYLYLLDQAEDFNPSQRQIASELNISRNSVVKALLLLEAHGMIRKLIQGDMNKASIYTFTAQNKRNT
jgi:predicted transcriptional regulator